MLDEKKYLRMNRFGPTKLPELAVKRSDLNVYSWSHYAPVKWIEYLQRSESQTKATLVQNKEASGAGKKRRGRK